MKEKIKRIVITVLATLGVLFIVIMLLPDDEQEYSESESVREESVQETVVTQEDHEGINTGGAPEAVPSVETISVGTDAKSATVMVYMNGSDLESEVSEASQDISEMLSSGIGDNANVIIQTMGTKKWHDYGISSKTTQTYKVEDGELSLIRDDLGQLDCTSYDTLSEFIDFCKTDYPADRYIFLFWNHGGGPVYGFGYDEWQDERASLTIAEMSRAFSENSDIQFDIIGMDCCIMANLETCYALAPYCSYTLLSEDFESGLGWDYTNWMKQLEEDPGISTPFLGKCIVDDIISSNEEDYGGDSACVGLYNSSTMKSLYSAWKEYAYQNEDALLNKNYSRYHRAKGRYSKSFWDSWDSYENEYGCNISGGGSCEYGYDYGDSGENDWIYDYDEDIWYLYEYDTLYLYDEESGTMCYYDEDNDEIYYYDEEDGGWVLMED